MPSSKKTLEATMKIIQTKALKTAATTTTTFESPDPEKLGRQPTDIPQHRAADHGHDDHQQVQEKRLDRQRRNWREAAMADVPVVIMQKTIRFR